MSSKFLPIEIRQGTIQDIFLIVVYCLIGMAGLGVVYLFPGYKIFIPDCLFYKITGIPCPSCGMTRCGESLAHFHLIDAFLYNPLLTIILAGFSIYSLITIGLFIGKRHYIAWRIQPGQEKFIRWGLLTIILINWVYLILYLR